MRSYFVELILVGLLVLAVAFFGYLGYGLLTAESDTQGFSGESALAFAARQMEFGPRPVTSDANLALKQWLLGELSSSGWQVAVQPYIAHLAPAVVGSDVLSTTVNTDGMLEIEATNIVAYKDPDDVTNPPIGLLIAHYDTRVLSDLDPDAANQSIPSPGANAAASGTALLLELAATLDVNATGHRLCIVLLNGEANRGLDGWDATYGGDYFLKGLREGRVPPCENPRFAVVVDLVGGANQQIFVDRNSNPALSTVIWQTAMNLGYQSSIVPELKWLMSGPHAAFNRAGIPAVMLADYDDPYRFTTLDTIEKLAPESLERVGRVLRNWLEQGAPLEQ